MGLYDDAVIHFSAAVADDPHRQDFVYSRALCYRKMGSFALAMKDYSTLRDLRADQKAREARKSKPTSPKCIDSPTAAARKAESAAIVASLRQARLAKVAPVLPIDEASADIADGEQAWASTSQREELMLIACKHAGDRSADELALFDSCLRKLRYFGGFSDKVLTQLCRQIKLLRKLKGDVVVSEGTACEGVYVLVEGSVSQWRQKSAVQLSPSNEGRPLSTSASSSPSGIFAAVDADRVGSSADGEVDRVPRFHEERNEFVSSERSGACFGELSDTAVDVYPTTVRVEEHASLLVLGRLEFDIVSKHCKMVETQARLEQLRFSPLFASWSDDRIKRISPMLMRETIEPETLFMRQGDACSVLYLPFRGSIKLYRRAQKMNKHEATSATISDAEASVHSLDQMLVRHMQLAKFDGGEAVASYGFNIATLEDNCVLCEETLFDTDPHSNIHSVWATAIALTRVHVYKMKREDVYQLGLETVAQTKKGWVLKLKQLRKDLASDHQWEKHKSDVIGDVLGISHPGRISNKIPSQHCAAGWSYNFKR
jgi:CRP-like cAMP-binding protein